MSKFDLYSLKRYLYRGALIRVRRNGEQPMLCECIHYNEQTKVVDTTLGFFSIDDVCEIFSDCCFSCFVSGSLKAAVKCTQFETVYKDGVFCFRPD